MTTIAQSLFEEFEVLHGVHDPKRSAMELIDKRKPHLRAYDLGRGKGVIIAGNGTIQFKDDSGDWQETDLTFDPAIEDGDDGWKMRKGVFSLFVPSNSIGFRYVSRNGSKLQYELTKWNGRPLRSISPNISPEIHNTAEYSGIIWRDVKPGLDIILTVNANGAEFFKILNNEAAADSLSWKITHEKGTPLGIQTVSQGVDSRTSPRIYKVDSEVTELVVGGQVIINRTEIFRKTVRLQAPITRIPFWSSPDDVTYPVKIDTEIIEDTVLASDDGYHVSSTKTWVTAPFKMQAINSTHLGSYQLGGGARWQSVPLPTNKTIDSASLTIQIFTLFLGGILVDIHGEDADSPGTFSTNDGPYDRVKTTASVNKNYDTTGSIVTNITGIIEEIYQRAGWAENNDMAVFCLPVAPFTHGELAQARVFQFGSVMPRLIINYSDLPTVEGDLGDGGNQIMMM